MAAPEHIYPVFDRFIQREDKEKNLQQKAASFWFTGLSGSGKTTIAKEFERLLHNKGFHVMVLDGDNVRSGLNANLGFSDEDRTENIRRIAEVNKLFNSCGVITVNCFVSPTKAIRGNARSIIGTEDFIEVFIDTPLAECEKRDVKGLYQKARKGEIKDFTGISAPFEAPLDPDIRVETIGSTPEACGEFILNRSLDRIKIS